MSRLTVFLALLGLVQCQLVCNYATERECLAASSTSTARCQWLTGSTCAGGTFGFCFPTVPCSGTVTCARRIVDNQLGAAVLFSSGCVPSNFLAVSLGECRCNSTASGCPNGCPSCSFCQQDGTCSAPPPPQCSAERPCPNGQTCVQKTCSSVCASPCPTGVQQYNCLVDPCLVPRPPGCPETAVCVSDTCGGCNRHYYLEGKEVCLPTCSDADCGPMPRFPSVNCSDGSVGGFTGRCRRLSVSSPCTWEIRECPSVCNATALLACRELYCPYGYQTVDTVSPSGLRVSCPICKCRDPPNPCSAITCPAVQCNVTSSGANAQPTILDGCCPSCPPSCDSITCPDVICPTGFTYQRIRGECCGRCVPQFNCSSVPCPPIATCPAGTARVRKECCDVCEPILPCANVRCAIDPAGLNCPTGYKAIIKDGECCPVCEPRPVCNAIDCRNVTSCPTGTRLTRDDLGCCTYCKPVDYCSTVLCAKPNCSSEAWIRREGQCCPQCPTCRDEATRLCNGNDDQTCRAGFFSGPNCSVPVPPTERKIREIIVRLCNDQCAGLDTQTIRILVSAIANVDAQFITVELLDTVTAEGRRCCRFKIVIAATVSSGVNVDGTTDQVSKSLSGTSGWAIETASPSGNASGSSSGAATVATCAALTVAAAALL